MCCFWRLSQDFPQKCVNQRKTCCQHPKLRHLLRECVSGFMESPAWSCWAPAKAKGFPKIRGTILGVPIIRTIVFGGLYWGPPI